MRKLYDSKIKQLRLDSILREVEKQLIRHDFTKTAAMVYEFDANLIGVHASVTLGGEILCVVSYRCLPPAGSQIVSHIPERKCFRLTLIDNPISELYIFFNLVEQKIKESDYIDLMFYIKPRRLKFLKFWRKDKNR